MTSYHGITTILFLENKFLILIKKKKKTCYFGSTQPFHLFYRLLISLYRISAKTFSPIFCLSRVSMVCCKWGVWARLSYLYLNQWAADKKNVALFIQRSVNFFAVCSPRLASNQLIGQLWLCGVWMVVCR